MYEHDEDSACNFQLISNVIFKPPAFATALMYKQIKGHSI